MVIVLTVQTYNMLIRPGIVVVFVNLGWNLVIPSATLIIGKLSAMESVEALQFTNARMSASVYKHLVRESALEKHSNV